MNGEESERHYWECFEREILQPVRRYHPHLDEDLLRRAFAFSLRAHDGQLRQSGQPFVEHCLEVAKILSELEMDHVTIAAGLLHDVVEDTGITIEDLRENFGPEVALLVEGVTKITGLNIKSFEEKQAENVYKLILSMIQDIRVIMIKFADRLHNMRTIEYLSERKQKQIALETREIYAPLAHRLGIARIKWELEDLSFKVLNPKAYEDLVRKIAEKREEREAYIRRVVKPIRRELTKAGIKAEITGRPKHLYSIYRKMVTRDKPFEQIYDLFAIRIIVRHVDECYYALGIVHTLYTPIHERFKDYIATPKSNMYQSIHTTVIGPEGRMVEIQIRTQDMHRTAEVGIAAHWRYKEGRTRGKTDEFDQQLVWLRQVLDGQWDRNAREFLEDFKVSLFQDEIFVFTPKGDLIKLPAGATPVDFAFAVHTEIGMHCLAAKVDGRLVNLDTPLRSGQTVEIITSAKQRPNPDWLKFVKTAKARSRIKRWIRDSLYEESIRLGREIFQKNLKKFNLKPTEDEILDVAQSFGFPTVDQLFASIGRGEINAQNVIRKLIPEKALLPEDDSIFKQFLKKVQKSSGIKVQGLNNLLINFSKCCQPVPGDQIIGFITKGRGIVVHRVDCPNIIRLIEDPDRKIEVEWDVERDRQFAVRLQIFGQDRKGLLHDIAEAISGSDSNILSINMKAENSVAYGTVIVEVRNLQHLTRVIKKVSGIQGVISIERLHGGKRVRKTQAAS